MKFWMKYMALVFCVAAACLLAWYDKTGWGWFLFIAFILAGSD